MAKSGWAVPIVFGILALFSSPALGQCTYQNFRFQSASLQSGTARTVGAVYKFSSVISGVDAYVTILASKNASVQNFDDDGSAYRYAWQPTIRNTASSSTPSWVKFKIQFTDSSTGATDTLPCVAMGVVDCDGNSNYQERISVLNQTSYKTISSTGVSFATDSFFNVNGDNMDYSGIDTSSVDAMAQVNFTNASTIIVKVGAIGSCTNTDRQSCLYFKPFYSLTMTLPVILNSFYADANDNQVYLNWSTVMERNNRGFDIERSSASGDNFTVIGRVPSQGDVDTPVNYQFSDEVPAGNYLYRLRQVDYNGLFHYSPVRPVHMGSPRLSGVSIVPNPIEQSCDLLFYSPVKSSASISITDASGQQIRTMLVDVARGENTCSLDMEQYKPGFYFIVIKNGTETVTHKVVKL